MRGTTRRRSVAFALVAIFSALLLAGPSARFLPAGVPAAAAASNPIVTENQNAGTDAWQIPEPTACAGGLAIPDCATSPPTTRTAERREIEGYASATSVPLGGRILFMVSTSTARPYYMQFFRLGWYGGAGGRLLTPPGTAGPTVGPLSGVVQPTPTPGAGPDYLIEASWPVAYTLDIPTSWTSGYYVVKLIRNDGFERYIPFLVRNDASTAPLLMQASVTTWQAYNWWGGKNLYGTFNFNTGSSGYGSDIAGPAAGVVSFDRPYATQEFMGWELEMVRYVEREGRDVTYATSVETHANPNLLLSPRRAAFLSVGHDEYWSGEMRTNVTNARDNGVNLAFFSANAVYFRIRFAADSLGTANRRIICYKNPAIDPITYRWRDQSLPENALIGVMSDGAADNNNFIVSNASSWIFSGAGLSNGSVITALVGYEYDRTYANGATPAGLSVVAHSPTSDGSFSESTVYTAGSGAVVFAAGTIQWASGLDGFRDPWANGGFNVPVSVPLQRTTANILDRFSIPPPPLPTVSAITPTSGPAGGGTVVTITGTGFSTTAGATTVRFGATAASGVSCASATSCSATSPAGSGAVDLTVTVGGLTSATSGADVFTYTAPTGVIFSDGFESGTLAAWDGTLGNGTLSPSAAAARSGGFGARLNDTASGQYSVLLKRLSSSLDDSYTRFSVRFSGMTGSPTVAYGRDDSSSAVRWILYYDARSQSFDYYIFNGAGQSSGVTASGVAPVGTWITVELRFTGTATGGGQIWVNGVTQPAWTISGNFATTAPYQRLQLWNDALGIADFDDVVVRTP